MTKHGCTEKAVKILKENIDDVTLLNLKQNKNPDISDYGTIIVGGSMHFGGIQKEIKKFCDNNRDILLQKRLGLYLCYMREDVAQKQFNESYPGDLRGHAIAAGLFGGECDFQKMNFIERKIMKKIVNSFKDSTSTKLNKEAILEFAQEIQKK